MLHQLEFKLQVEMQYKKGIDKMAKLYQADGDKKAKADAEGKRVESERKIALLQTALKRYKTLYILDDAEEDDSGTSISQDLSEYLPNTLPQHRRVRPAPELKERGKTTCVTNLYPANSRYT